MKKALGLMMGLVLLSVTVTAASPAGVQRGLDERLFGVFVQHRAELNLTEEQNTQVDALLQEMKDARIAVWQREIEHVQNALASFVSDDFQPGLMLPIPPDILAEMTQAYNRFMAQETSKLHDILTADQRQQLIELMAQQHTDN
ncbi:MAG: hypothetical protein GXO70_09955 [Acidobacteria bacterium]|nr:hypothetical protein [Acidobacteriota bacterium]